MEDLAELSRGPDRAMAEFSRHFGFIARVTPVRDLIPGYATLTQGLR